MEINFEKLTNITNTNWTAPDGTSIPVQVRNYLNADEMAALYYRVLDTVFDDAGEWHPEFFEYAWRYGVIDAYSDIEMPQNTNDAYLLCYSSLWDIILDITSSDQLTDIYEAITNKLEDNKQKVYASMHWKELLEDVKTVTDAMLNLDHIPEWLSDKTDNTTHSLLQKA